MNSEFVPWKPAVACRRAGPASGPKLLLLHGIGSNGGSFQPQLAQLAGELDMAAWDAPGYGHSADPPPGFRLEDFADAALALLDALGWSTAHVLGHSFGGVVAQMLYQRHPQRVRSLILSDTNAGSGTLPEPERSERVQRRLADLATLSPRELAERRAPNLVPPDAPPELVAELIRIMAQVRPAGYAAAAVAMGTADLRAFLSAIAVPTLVVHGDCDTVIRPETAVDVARAIPGAKLVFIPGAGHASNQHKPEEYTTAVRQFLMGGVA